jgi:hypothetical protein
MSDGGHVMKKSWRDIIRVHPATDLFPLMSETDPTALKELGEDIKKNGLRVPVVLLDGEDGQYLLDGRNRLDAAEAAGFKIALDQNGGIEWLRGRHIHVTGDPYAYVISANIHRRHLTAGQKRELIGKLLAAKPEQSDRQVAEAVKASPTTVGKVRAEMESKGDVSKLDTRTDTKGRKQAAKKTRKGKPRDPDAPRPGDAKISQNRSIFFLNSRVAISMATYEGPVDEEIMAAARNAAAAWVELTKSLERRYQPPKTPSEPPPDDNFPDLPASLRRIVH